MSKRDLNKIEKMIDKEKREELQKRVDKAMELLKEELSSRGDKVERLEKELAEAKESLSKLEQDIEKAKGIEELEGIVSDIKYPQRYVTTSVFKDYFPDKNRYSNIQLDRDLFTSNYWIRSLVC